MHTLLQGIRAVKPLILYEVKKAVSPFLATIDEKHLAQLFVEGYYLLMGGESTANTIVVALTSVAITTILSLSCPLQEPATATSRLSGTAQSN